MLVFDYFPLSGLYVYHMICTRVSPNGSIGH